MLLPLILVSELVLGGLLVNFSSHQAQINQRKHQIKRVLGVYLAQDNTPSGNSSTPAPTGNSSTPADNSGQSTDQNQPSTPSPTNSDLNSTNSTPAPTGNSSTPADNSGQSTDQNQPSTPSPTNSDLNSTNSTPAPTEQPLPTTSNFNSQIDTTSTDSNLLNQVLSTPSPEVSPEPNTSTTPIPTEATSPTNQVAPVLNPETIVTPLEINPQVTEQAKKEDEKIDQAATPTDKATLQIGFAQNSVKEIDRSLRQDDFSSINFQTQRLNDQLSQAIKNIEDSAPNQKGLLHQQLVSLCQQADLILKSSELVVPEENEQDLEISRGKCLNP